MTLYCQDCGAELVATCGFFGDADRDEWWCKACGSRFLRPEHYSDDQIAGWLGFPPSQTAA